MRFLKKEQRFNIYRCRIAAAIKLLRQSPADRRFRTTMGGTSFTFKSDKVLKGSKTSGAVAGTGSDASTNGKADSKRGGTKRQRAAAARKAQADLQAQAKAQNPAAEGSTASETATDAEVDIGQEQEPQSQEVDVNEADVEIKLDDDGNLITKADGDQHPAEGVDDNDDDDEGNEDDNDDHTSADEIPHYESGVGNLSDGDGLEERESSRMEEVAIAADGESAVATNDAAHVPDDADSNNNPNDTGALGNNENTQGSTSASASLSFMVNDNMQTQE